MAHATLRKTIEGALTRKRAGADSINPFLRYLPYIVLMLALRAIIIGWVDRLLALMDSTRSFGWSVGLVLMTLSLIPKFSHMLPGDSSVYVYLAGRMLDGEKYFTDFFEYNTPFAMGIYALPMMVGRALGISDTLSAKIFAQGLIVVSIALVHMIISKSRAWLVVTHYNALIIALFFTLNFRNDFYSNELTTKSTVFLCFILPYLFSLQLYIEKTPVSKRMEWVVGLLQGIAVWYKPQYVLFPLLMELYLAWRMRSLAILFRTSNWLAAVTIIAGYGVILPIYFPGYLQSIPYFFIYYPANTGEWISWVDNISTALLYCLPLLIWLASTQHRLAGMGILLAAVLAQIVVLNTELILSFDQKSLLAFFVGVAFLYSLLVFLRAPLTLKQGLGHMRKTFAMTAVILASICIFSVIGIVQAFIPHVFYREKVANDMVEYVHRYATNEPIYTLSDNTEHFVLAINQLGQRPTPVFHSLRMLVDMTDRTTSLPPEEWQKGYDYFYGTTLQFFKKTPPRLVFVSRISTSRELTHCMPLPIDIMLAQSPAFANIWEHHYRQIGTIIGTREPVWPEEKTPQKVYPTRTWLDVYLRKDD